MTLSPWTPERDTILRRLAAEGLSGSQIAAEIGMSRGAVIGRASRIKIKIGHLPAGRPKIKRSRINASNIRNKAESRKSDPGVAATVRIVPTPAVPSKPVLFMERRSGQCCWIVSPAGTPVEHMMVCGAPCPHMTDAQNCPGHEAVARVKRTKPKPEFEAAA